MTEERKIRWQSRLETYFAETGEQALCYAWMHRKAEAMFSARTGWIDLPVIVLGTVNGAISVGSDNLFGTAQYASVGVGVVALITAILATIGSYFAWAKRTEAHRIAAISYDKLNKFLSVEMSLPRAERMEADDLLKYVKVESDRLMEISPLIPSAIIEMFKARFGGDKYAEISKPAITNGLHAVEVYRADDATPGFSIRIPAGSATETSHGTPATDI